MTTTEIAVRQRSGDQMLAKIQYAKALADSGLLPASYRRQPANVLYAVEYGDMLGLAPMAAITGIHVIEGKPTASAGLISALVRQAGHKLQVWGDNKSATCVITRSDDPEHPFRVTWTLQKNSDDNPSAEQAKLLNKPVWQQYPASMLKSRAITQCARDACEEVLFGLHYTPEELGADVSEDGQPQAAPSPDDAADAEIPAPDPGPMPAAGEIRRIAATPADDPWYEGSADQEWVNDARAKAAAFTDDEGGRELWRQASAKREDGSITKQDDDALKQLILARFEELKTAGEPAGEVIEGVIVADAPLEPDDPWAAKVEAITSAEDAEAAEKELAETEGLPIADGHRILAAIKARAAQVAA